MEIKNVSIIGMGALGLMYGALIEENNGKGTVTFIMDEDRIQRHKNDVYKVNEKEVSFNIKTPKEAGKADLAIFATKYSGLQEAVEMMEPVIGEDTIIISVLNGIISEEIIREKYGDEKLLYCLGEGMDSMREGSNLVYTRMGQLRFGAVKECQKSSVNALHDFFEKVSMPHKVDEDILHSLWGKFMLNVGVNQTCMVYETTYGAVTTVPEYRDKMLAAMDEVIEISKAEGINLTREDRDYYFGLLLKLNKDGYPSMRQDAVAKRKSEVDMFAGTVLELGKKHKIDTPVNKMYYERVKEIESSY